MKMKTPTLNPVASGTRQVIMLATKQSETRQEELLIGHPHPSAAGGQMAISELFQGEKHGESESGSKLKVESISYCCSRCYCSYC